jgi:hypothetical protein
MDDQEPWTASTTNIKHHQADIQQPGLSKQRSIRPAEKKKRKSPVIAA